MNFALCVSGRPPKPERYASIAQLVEHLTLNQGVRGSSPRWCTINGPLVKWLRRGPLTPQTGVRLSYGSPHKEVEIYIVGVNNDEGPPVPIPNTEVKLISADNTCLETDRKDRSTPTLRQNREANCSAVFYLL